MTLRGRPAGFLSSTYEVEDPDSGASGTLCMRWVREASEIDVDDPDGPSGTFTFERESFLHGAFLLVDDEGETLACAEKPSALLRSFEIEHDDETWRLEASSPFSRTFHLLDEQGASAASSRPASSRGASAQRSPAKYRSSCARSSRGSCS